MATLEADFLGAVETHDLGELTSLLDGGMDVRVPIKGKLPIHWLTEMYARSDRFPDCLRLLLDRGAVLDDPTITPVLLSDADTLKKAISANPKLLTHRTTLVSCFTPLVDATLLHVAAEYGHADAARVLIEAGADVNATAGVDEHGLNGHTPVFHTVNSNANRSRPILEMLVSAGARCDVRLAGVTWGKGFEWETTCFDVTPISYAQCGLLPQFHRKEADTYENIRLMLKALNRPVPPFDNVPNRYLFPTK